MCEYWYSSGKSQWECITCGLMPDGNIIFFGYGEYDSLKNSDGEIVKVTEDHESLCDNCKHSQLHAIPGDPLYSPCKMGFCRCKCNRRKLSEV